MTSCQMSKETYSKGFDKSHMRLIFFRFGSDKEATKKWLSKLARRIPSTRDLINAPKAADEEKIERSLVS